MVMLWFVNLFNHSVIKKKNRTIYIRNVKKRKSVLETCD